MGHLRKTEKKKVESRKKYSVTIASLLIIICILTTALAIVLYTLTVPMQFRVVSEYGLELWDESQTSKITSLSWSDFSVGGSQSQSFYIKNVGNEDANVTVSLGSYDSGAWTISHTHVDEAIAKDGFGMLWSVSITEVDAYAMQWYSCDLVIEQVDSFLEANESLSVEASSEVVYETDTSGYLSVTSATHNGSSCFVGDTIRYTFTTENINSSASIDSFSYTIELRDNETQALVSELVNTMHDCIPDLAFGESVAVQHDFDTSAWLSGSYYFKLRLTGHNSEPAEEYGYAWQWNESPNIRVTTYEVNGFTYPNEPSEIHLIFTNVDSTTHVFTFYEAKIVETDFVIVSASPSVTLGSGETYETAWIPFSSPSEYGIYTIRVTTQEG